MRRTERMLAARPKVLSTLLRDHYTFYAYREALIQAIMPEAQTTYALSMIMGRVFANNTTYAFIAMGRWAFREILYSDKCFDPAYQVDRPLHSFSARMLIKYGVVKPEHMKGWEHEEV